MFPLDKIRKDTPGIERVVHFNNAGSALPPQVVVDTVIGHIKREAEIGGYEAAQEADARLRNVYDSIARLIGGHADEIAVIENATRAWDMVVYGFAFKPGDRVLTARAEYASNAIALLQLKKRHGIEVVLIDDDEFGQISLEQLEVELRKGRVAMVSLTHVPTNGGLVNPAAAVGKLCKEYGAFFMLDACQSVGHVPISVQHIGCDALSATGRKYLRGPRGTGFLWIRPEVNDKVEPPFLDLHSATWTAPDAYEIRADAKRFENWETNYAGKLGLGAAVVYALELGIENTWPRVRTLATTLRNQLAAVPGITVHDKGQLRGGIVTFTHDTLDAAAVQQKLSLARVNTSVSPVEYARFDLPHRNLPALVRASVHYYNTDDEIDHVVSSLQR